MIIMTMKSEPSSMDEYITQSEACDFLSVTTRTLTRYRENSIIKGYRLPGGQWRYLRTDIEALMSGGNNQGERDAECLSHRTED
jgi:excisionase family DNA binding protein